MVDAGVVASPRLGTVAWACAALCLLAGLTGCTGLQRETVVSIPKQDSLMHADPPVSAMDVMMAQKITSDALYRIYSQHLIQGALPDQRFLFKRIAVTGVVEGVDRGLPGKAFLELGTHDRDAFTYAEPASFAQSLLETLKPGQTVQLVCWGAGELGGSPLLRSCRLASAEPAGASSAPV